MTAPSMLPSWFYVDIDDPKDPDQFRGYFEWWKYTFKYPSHKSMIDHFRELGINPAAVAPSRAYSSTPEGIVEVSTRSLFDEGLWGEAFCMWVHVMPTRGTLRLRDVNEWGL